MFCIHFSEQVYIQIMSAVENFGYVLEYVLDYVEINVLTVALGLVVFVLLFWSSILEKHKYPPGPIPLPFIGNGYSIFAKNKSQFRYSKYICLDIVSISVRWICIASLYKIEYSLEKLVFTKPNSCMSRKCNQ